MTLPLTARIQPEVAAALRDGEYLRDLYVDHNINELCREVGVGVDTMRKALRYHGIEIRGKGHKVSRETRRTLVRDLVLRAYWQADRCPPSCPGRARCLDADCVLGSIIEEESCTHS